MSRRPPIDNPSVHDRQKLAGMQAAVVSALVAGGVAPPGIDPTYLQRTADTLAQKRSRSTAKAWPSLAAALGTDFDRCFAAYSTTHSTPESPFLDGLFFAQSLPQALLPDAARVELLTATVGSGWPLRWAYLRDAGRICVAVRTPWRGTRLLTIPVKRAP
jgi:hypothetical protein